MKGNNMSYLRRRDYLTRDQHEKLQDDQVQNSAGGFVWAIDKWHHAKRFLTLGSEGGTYYADEQDITKQNVRNLQECAKEDGVKLVNLIVDQRDKVAKRDAVLYAFAVAFSTDVAPPSKNGEMIKAAVHREFTNVVRTGSDLLQFVSYINDLRGWGRSLKHLIRRWYATHAKNETLTYQVTKYQNRHGWTHRDVLRQCHYDSNDPLIRWIVGAGLGERTVTRKSGLDTLPPSQYPALHELPEYLIDFEQLRKTNSPTEVKYLIKKNRFTHEMVPNEFKDKPDIWEALLENMPMIAMVRNLGKMSSVGLLKPLGDHTQIVLNKLSEDHILKSKIHPIQMLIAYLTYKRGAGVKGSLTWDAVGPITDALERGFYTAFGNVEPTGKSVLIGVDVSGSMTVNQVCNCPDLTPAKAAAAMAMVFARTEPNYHIIGYTTEAKRVGITAQDSLESAVKRLGYIGGSTDCSVPVQYANSLRMGVDLFITITDNETWAGNIHPAEALQQYRQKLGRPEARLATVAMTATNFTIADPADAGMLDCVGFNTETPQLVSKFGKGEI